MAKLMVKWFQVLVLAGGLVVASGGWSEEQPAENATVMAGESPAAEESAEEIIGTKRPSYGAALADTLLVRPITLTATVLGAAIWVVTVPFTAVTGTVGEAGQTLVVEPFATTFFRCLGCTEVGWRKLPPADVK
jgi:hypothetical protein